jgi:hypothetical protein
MTFRSARSLGILVLSFLSLSLMGTQCPFGLKIPAYFDLHASGVDRYVGEFQPATEEVIGEWTKFTFDTEGGEGPTCIDGSPFTVFARERNPHKVAIFLNGGGACWQNFYQCSITASGSPPGASGIFADTFDAGGGNFIANPLSDWSMMFVSYCDGSVFGGDNDVVDASFPPAAAGGVRRHRGVRNVTAAIDLARDLWPHPAKVLLTGSSAGGYGVAGISPFIVRFNWGNLTKLYVFNDSGPAVTNLDDPASIQTRVNDWAYTQFNPSSCTDCTTDKQPAELLEWMLENDGQVRSALYSTDGDSTIRFFLTPPAGPFLTQAQYRGLLLDTHDPINDRFPNRHKRFIRSGSVQHTALGGSLYYTAAIDGVPLHQWMGDFVNQKAGWVDLIQDLIPTPF